MSRCYRFAPYVVLVLLALAAVYSWLHFAFASHPVEGHLRETEGELMQVRWFVELFWLQHNRLPTSLDELEHSFEGHQPITGSVPDDPWGTPYQYQSEGTDGEFVLYSVGPDGEAGTEDDIQPEGRR
jgi:hypothetical protein